MEKRACPHYCAIFRNLFGLEAEVTPENCLLVQEKGLLLDWAAKKFFYPDGLERYERGVGQARENHAKKAKELKEELGAAGHKSSIMDRVYHEAIEASLKNLRRAKPSLFCEVYLTEFGKNPREI